MLPYTGMCKKQVKGQVRESGSDQSHQKSYWRQDLGLGDDAVWQTVLPALSGDLSPGNLEACDSLIGCNPGHTPQEVTSDVSFIHGKGSCEVLWFGQNLWLPC